MVMSVIITVETSYLLTALGTIEQVLLKVGNDREQLCCNMLRMYITYDNCRETYDSKLRWP